MESSSVRVESSNATEGDLLLQIANLPKLIPVD